jgi:hypothetical protein
MIRQFATLPPSPEKKCFCVHHPNTVGRPNAKIILSQFGGNPDCGSCGCVESMCLAAVAAHKLGGIIPVGDILKPRSGLARLARLGPSRLHSRRRSRKGYGFSFKKEDWRHL